MLYDEVQSRIAAFEESQSFARTDLENHARETILNAADSGSRKSILHLAPDWKAQVSWLRKQWRGQGISMSVHGNFLHFNVTGPRTPRRGLHRDDNHVW